MLRPGHAHADVRVDKLGPAEVVGDAVGAGELHPQRPFRRRDGGRWGEDGAHGFLGNLYIVVPAKAGTHFLYNMGPRQKHSGATGEEHVFRHVLSGLERNLLVMTPAARAGVGHLDERLLHVPGAGGAALGAQAAVQAYVLVLHHDPLGLQWTRNVEILRQVAGRRIQLSTQRLLFVILGEGDAIHRADVDAGVALDAEAIGEYRLHVAVQAALRFFPRGGDVEAELDLHLHVLQRGLDVGPGHLVARVDRDVVVVAPFVDAHLLRNERHTGSRSFLNVLVVQKLVYGNGGVMAVRHGPDDVLRAERGVAAEEDVGNRRLQGFFI